MLGGGNLVFAQKSLPYSYGFENNLTTEGWIGGQGNGTSTTGLSNSYNAYHSGSYGYRFFPVSETTQYLVSAELQTTSNRTGVSFFYRGYGATYPVTFYVGYSTTDTNTSSFTWDSGTTANNNAWTEYTGLFPAGTKYIAIKYSESTTYYQLYVDDFVIEEDNPYKTPTSFVVSSYTGTSTTFTWAKGNDETAWELAYSTNKDFTPGTDDTTLDVTERPYTLSGLTTGTTYYAAIRANYGSGHYSEWSDKISFVPRNETEFTINDGSATNSYAPIYGGNASKIACSQVVIPSSMLINIQNRQITKLTFYASQTSVSWGEATYEVYLKITDTSTYSSWTGSFESWGTNVFNEGTLTVSDGTMVVNLNTPFNYTSGNLLIGFKQISTGTNSSVSWYGVTTSGVYTVCYSNNSTTDYSSKTTISPKITFTTTAIENDPVKIDGNGYTTFASPRSLDLSSLPSGLKAYKAAVDGSTVRFTEINQAVPANTGMLLEGTANTTYSIPVADSGTAPEGNEFLVNSTGGTFTADAGYTYYGLLKNSDPLTFGVFAPATVAIPTNKAYLKVADEGGEARQLTCVFEDGSGTTAISTVGVQTNRNGGQYFDLQGRRVANPTKGVYVVDGKKLIVR